MQPTGLIVLVQQEETLTTLTFPRMPSVGNLSETPATPVASSHIKRMLSVPKRLAKTKTLVLYTYIVAKHVVEGATVVVVVRQPRESDLVVSGRSKPERDVDVVLVLDRERIA